MDTTSADLRQLHDRYVRAVNMAVAADDPRLVQRLAAEYDAVRRDTVRGRRAG